MSEPLTFGSLFAGIGGLDLGLERAGMRGVWQVENNEYASRVLARHWPNVERFSDVRDVGAHNLSSVDLICGGFPCQDISYAGKGAGLAGERSGLWYEFARIVRELRPRYVLVENVAALLTRGIDAVLGELAILGYDAEWDCVSAASVGAPHLRKRIFVVAYTNVQQHQGGASPHGWPPAPDVLADAASPRLHATTHAGVYRGEASAGPRDAEPERRGCDVAHADRERLAQREGREAGGLRAGRVAAPVRRSWWATEPDVGRVANGVPSRVDRLRGLGNAVVPQVAEYIGRLIVQHAQRERVAA